MRNTQALKEFIYKWRNASLPSKEMLHEYKPFCRDLLFEEEELVLETTGILKINIEAWAQKMSPVYSKKSN